MKMKQMPALVLAGGDLEKEFAAEGISGPKALLPLAGRPMLAWVLDRLKACGRIGPITLVAPGGSLGAEMDRLADQVVPSAKTLMGSLGSGLDAITPAANAILVVPCDVPFLSDRAIIHFLDSCAENSADFHYAYLTRETSRSAYPKLHHTYVPLREGVVCGGGLFLVNPAIRPAAEELFGRLTRARKHPWQMAGILGVGTIGKFLIRQLGVGDLERKVSSLLGHPVRAILSPYAEVGFNVDHPTQWHLAQKIITDGMGQS